MEANTTNYANRLVTPALGGKVILRGTVGNDDLNLSSTSTIANVSTYNLRQSDLIQSFKVEAKVDSVKVFVTAEGAQSSLNQTNVIFQDFLPSPQQYPRGTIIPGVAYVRDKFEVEPRSTCRRGITPRSSTISASAATTSGSSRSCSRNTDSATSSPPTPRCRSCSASGTMSISATSTAPCSTPT